LYAEYGDHMTRNHATARRWAQDNIPIFPCMPGSKKPACPNGYLDATTNLIQIDKWWSEADYNLAFCPETAGLCVIDQDLGGNLTDLQLPKTYTVTTPSDGAHLYFYGSLPSSVGKLAPGVDTRGRGGYVLLPPSLVDGREYKPANTAPIAELPTRIVALLTNQQHEQAKSAYHVLDLPTNVERARTLLNQRIVRGDVAIEGRGGDDHTYRLACEILNLGLSPEGAITVMAEWNEACIPPWSPDELSQKVNNAASYMQNEAGAWATPSAAEAFKASAAILIEKPKKSRFYPEDDDEMDTEPDPRWQVEGVIQERSTIMLYGPSGGGKSFIALDLGLAIATGKPTFGTTPTITGPVFYAANEGRSATKGKRRRAWRIAHEVVGKTPFYVMAAPMLCFPDEVTEFKAEIIKRLSHGSWPALIIVETVSKMMVGLDPTRDAPQLVKFCDHLCEYFHCSVMAVHHTGHDEARGPRDSSAYHAGFDTVLRVKGNLRECPAIEVQVMKHKDQEEREEPFTFVAKPMAGSLVLQGTTSTEHRTYTSDPSEIDGPKVGAVLARLGAYGRDQGLATPVLEVELKVSAALLRKLAKGKLAPYCEGSGRDLLWYLPTIHPTP